MDFLNARKIAFILIFAVLSLLVYNINVFQILGVEGQNFTMFQFLGPVSGGFLGVAGGAVSVLAVEIGNFILKGKAIDLMGLVRLFPLVLAAIYFGAKKDKISAMVPLIAMVLFWLHPNGQAAWYYALYWVIPLAASFYKENLFARSLGATFTAHSIGSVAFLYAFNLPADVWVSLVPVVAFERLVFAIGICLSYYAMTTVLSYFSTKIDLRALNIEKQYSLVKA